MGIERVLIACDAEGVFSPERPRVDAFVVNGLGTGGDHEVANVVAVLRENGLRVERAYGDRSVKAQWKAADKSRAVYGVMLGRAEVERQEVGDQGSPLGRASRGAARHARRVVAVET